MEHVLLGANQLLPKARDFQAEFEKNGAYSNASTGPYDVIYEAECADFEWDRILGLLLVAITKPLFLDEEFAAEFGNVREELTARSNNHFRYLSLSLREKYGFSVLTDQERLKLMDNVTVDDVKQHYQATHTSSNLRFVIAGNLPITRRKTISKVLENIELPAGDGRYELPNERPRSLGAPLYLNNETVENLYFYIDTFAQRSLSEAEHDSLMLINSMLTETLYSKILGTAREQGLLYHLNSGIGQSKRSTNWWFGTQVMPMNAGALFGIIVNEMSTVFKGDLAPSDIIAAKQYALGKHQQSGQTVSGTAAGYSNRYFFDEHIDDYYKIPQRIDAITKEGIIDSSKAMFSDRTWGLGVLGNCGQPFTLQLFDQITPLWQ